MFPSFCILSCSLIRCQIAKLTILLQIYSQKQDNLQNQHPPGACEEFTRLNGGAEKIPFISMEMELWLHLLEIQPEPIPHQ